MRNRILLPLALLMIFTGNTLAQQTAAPDTAAKRGMRGIVADIVTRTPQRDVKIHLNTGKTVTTPWDGSYSISDTAFSSATVVRSGYLARKMNREEFSDTIFLLPTERLLNEVVVIGHKRNLNDIFTPINSTDAALIAAGQNLSFNPLGLLVFIVDKLGIIPERKTKAERKREKRKAILENY